MPFYHWEQNQLILNCYLKTQAKLQAFDGFHQERVIIRLTEAPIDGQANQQLISFLAKQFSVPKNRIEIIKGLQSRNKVVIINTPKILPEVLNIEIPSS